MRGFRWSLALVIVALLGLAGCAKRVADEPALKVAPGGPRQIEHRVADGETLRLIADNYYGDPGRAADVAAANGLTDPEALLPGSLLKLDFSEQEWDSARRRASALGPYNRGVDLLAKERLQEAERQFRLAVDTAPELLSARYNLALVLLKRGRNTDALDLLTDLIVRRPREPDFLFARGNALFQLARFDEAVEQFRAVLAVAPEHLRAAFSLARSLQEGGDIDGARAAWRRYLELDDSSSWATNARRQLRKLTDAPAG